MDCVFCRINKGEIPAKFVYQDDEFIVFPDIAPLAPTHLLLAPRGHYPALADLPKDKEHLAGKLMLLAREIARKVGVDKSGYRLVLNTGRDGDQGVPHMHLHLLAGRHMSSQLG
ncbi:MAG: histidine triad nucleotide-binding protein [Chloroflexi bacterium]|nr:histidine triad nucleotide-binding protein [Chloroflexota bacterium]